MNDQSSTSKKKPVRVAMTKKQASSGIGLEFVEMTRLWIEDGKLDLGELAKLRAWLNKASGRSLPAVSFLRNTIHENGLDRTIAPNTEGTAVNQIDSTEYKLSEKIEQVDEFTSYVTRSDNRPIYWKGHKWELDKVLRAIIRVLPKEERDEAKTRHKAALEEKSRKYDAVEQEWKKSKWEAYRAEWARKRSLYAEEWAEESASEQQIDYIRALGGHVSEDEEWEISRLEASDRIDRLMAKKYAKKQDQKSDGTGLLFPVIFILVAATVFIAIYYFG